jgi:hypothetical protein
MANDYSIASDSVRKWINDMLDENTLPDDSDDGESLDLAFCISEATNSFHRGISGMYSTPLTTPPEKVTSAIGMKAAAIALRMKPSTGVDVSRRLEFLEGEFNDLVGVIKSGEFGLGDTKLSGKTESTTDTSDSLFGYPKMDDTPGEGVFEEFEA